MGLKLSSCSLEVNYPFISFSLSLSLFPKIMAKAMKAMKAMKKSVIAKGKLAKMVVFRGTKTKTGSGLKKSDLMKNKNGKIVSRKQSANGKEAYARIKGWTVAVTKARKFLGLKGFIAVKKGSPLYKKAKELYSQ